MFSFSFLILDTAQKITFGPPAPLSTNEKIIIATFVIFFLLLLFIPKKNKQQKQRDKAKYQAWLNFYENYVKKMPPVASQQEKYIQELEAKYYFVKEYNKKRIAESKENGSQYIDLLKRGYEMDEQKVYNDWQKAKKEFEEKQHKE